MMQLSFMAEFIIELNGYRVDGTMEVSIEIRLSRPLQIQTLLEKHVRSRKLEIARCGFGEVCKTSLAKMCEIAFGIHWFSIKLWSALVINNSQQILRSLCPRYHCVFINDSPKLIKFLLSNVIENEGTDKNTLQPNFPEIFEIFIVA